MGNMVTGHNEYIILQSVDFPANRFRIYRVTVNMGPSQGKYSANCSWGRVGGFGQAKVFPFQNGEGLLKFIQALLLKRKRHGYGVVEKSAGFPTCTALALLPMTSPADGQMSLLS
jgi:predicted DNA-binding WGR domain protein